MKKVSCYLLITLIITSCNSIKRVTDGELLLKSNTIYVDKKKNRNLELNELLVQRPNSRTLGIPLSVYLYNLGNQKNSKTPKEWGTRNPKTYRFFKKLFSEKQSIGVANTFIGINNWFLNSGEEPVIINDAKTKKTINNLNTYYFNKGYFKNNVSSTKDTLSKKKGKISYHITQGKPFFLDTISRQIPSKILDSIYMSQIKDTYLVSGEQYNVENFIKETARIVKLFRNSGLSNFSNEFIGYDAQTIRTDNKTNVITTISDEYFVEENGKYISKPFAIQKIERVNVYTDYIYSKRDEPYLDTIAYNGINFIAHDKVKFNPKHLAKSIFTKPNEIYSDTLRNLTRSHLKSLKNFKAISIQFKQIDDTKLEANIRLTPIEKFTIGAETELTHSNLRKLGISGKFSIVNRNAFKGSELFKFSFIGSFFNTSTQPSNNTGFFNAWEIGADLSLEIPRFVAPFGLSKLVDKSMSPKTMFSIGTGIQKNIGLDKQTVTAIIDYNWKFNSKKSINLELFNVQYIRNLNIGEYFNIYNSEFTKFTEIAKTYRNDPNFVISKSEAPTLMKEINQNTAFQNSNPTEYKGNANINNRYNIITTNFIIPTIAYTFTYNNQTNYKDNNFSSFRVRVANSGNILPLFSKTKNESGVKTFSNTQIAQYFKTDIEYKQFWDVTSNSVLGFRSFLGVVIPYGNSDIPFTKNYFAGGSNDIRAWKTYDLGPGATLPGLEYNVGNLKFLTSLEYRFDLVGNLKGGLFIDAGNIWDVTNSSFVNDDAKFQNFDSLKQIAVGSGFGARYDLNFLVLRLDIGFKTHEPYLKGSKWFKNFNFNNAVYNIGINYPF